MRCCDHGVPLVAPCRECEENDVYLTLEDYPPPVRGGQGRTDRSVTDDAMGLLLLVLLIVGLAAVCWLAWPAEVSTK